MDAPRRSTRRLGAIVVLAWIGAAVLTGTVAWRAVAVLDADGQRTGVLSSADVGTSLAEAQAAAASASATASPSSPTGTPEPTDSPTEEPTATPTTTPTGTAEPSDPSSPTDEPASPAAPKEVVRTWHVDGGTVAASCVGSRIDLLYATPADGWTVEVGSGGPEHIEVELHRSERETKVEAECRDGVPKAEVRTEGEHDEDEGDED